MARPFPDPEISLRDAIDFILNSNLGRKALHCETFPGLAVFLRDLLNEIYMLEKSCHMPEFTDHGISHLCSLIDRISNWTCSTKTKNNINILETLDKKNNEPSILLVATLIHDIGMLSQKAEDLDSKHQKSFPKGLMETSEWVRKTHVLRIRKLLKRIIRNSKQFESKIIQSAINIASAHDKWPQKGELDNLSGRRAGLAAIICVSDLLDEDANRCDTYTLIEHKEGTVLNKAHWIRHSLTAKRIYIQNNKAIISLFKIPRTDVSLLLPFYDALRNHFKLIKLYNEPLNKLGIENLKVSITYSKDKEATELKGWDQIPGFQTQSSLLFNLLSTFFPYALLDERKLNKRDITSLKKIGLKRIDLDWYYAIPGIKEARSEYEQHFISLIVDIKNSNNITQKNKQEYSIKYLQNEAMTAHMNGDGVLVNHLCSIALSKIIKWEKDNVLKVTIKEFYWATILSLYWLTNDYMLDAVNQVIRNYKGENENTLLSWLRSLIFLVEQSLSDCAEDINEIKENEIDWIKTFNPIDELFLSYCIELLFVRKPEGPAWYELVNTWISKFPDYSDALKRLQDRLQTQANSLYPEAYFPSANFPKEANKDLYDAWEARLNCEWDTLDCLLDRLVNKVSFGFAESLAVWHLHHLSHFRRKRDPEIIGLTRRLLIISGRYGAKQHHINEIRDHNFNKMLSGLWEKNIAKETANQNATKRFSCFRLALLNELFALREWDLMTWRASINQKAQACYVLIQNPNLKNDERVDFSISAFNLLALSAKLNNKELLHQRIAFLIDNASQEQREEIIKKLTILRPMMWHSVLNAFFLISDAIPKQSLNSVAEWCVKYDEHPTDFESGWRLDWLTFWGDIFGYYSEIDNIYEIIHPVILKAAGNPFIWHSDDRNAFEQYIANAPFNYVCEVIDQLFEVDITQNINFNEIRWSAVYHAAKKRKEIACKYNNKLIETATSPVLKLYLNLNYTEGKFEPLNDPEKRTWIRNDILSQTKNVLGRNGKSFGMGGGVNPEVLSLITWPNVEKKLIQELIKSFELSIYQ